MATITTEIEIFTTLINGKRGRGKTIHKKYELAPEMWDLVKEYAGIYNIGIKWDMPLAKLSREIRSVCRFRITNVNCSSVPLEHRISVLKRGFWKYLNKGKFLHKAGTKKEILNLLSNKFNVRKELWKPPSSLKKGDEVIYQKQVYRHYGHWTCGIIKTVNKNSVLIQPYKIGNRRENELGATCYVWDKTNIDNTKENDCIRGLLVYNRNDVVGNTEMENRFIEGDECSVY